MTPEPPITTDASFLLKNRVLLVDDDRITLNLLAFLFKSFGWDSRQSMTGKGALEILSNEGEFDLIITDLQMPEMDGFQLLEQIRKTYGPTKPIVFIFSGFVDQACRVRAAALGAQLVIHKSTNAKDIYEAMKSFGLH